MEPALAAIFQTTEEGVWVVAGIFARVGAACSILPGVGERAVPMRFRLGLAVAITILLAPLIGELIPQAPTTPIALTMVLAGEAAVGLVIGLAFRLLVFALQTAGFVAAQSISVAQMFGAGVAPEPEPTIATLLSMAGIVLLMMAGMHVRVVSALAELYSVFPFGRMPPSEDLAEWGIRQVSRTFSLGVSLAAPFVAVGFAYNIALGALNRAMPQLLVALVGVPFLVWIGVLVLYQAVPSIFASWGGAMDELIRDPLGGLP